MTPLVHAALVFAHLAGAIVWLGGMVFAHFALRPAAVLVLEPPVRLPLMAQALGRFFRLVAVAVVAIVVSGWVLLARVGMAHAPVGWHVMLALGLVTENLSADGPSQEDAPDSWPPVLGELRLTEYDDMTNIITMDPIHDVDPKRGWPFDGRD